jgi:uncharacterized protein YoaH (UPF0181 family)
MAADDTPKSADEIIEGLEAKGLSRGEQIGKLADDVVDQRRRATEVPEDDALAAIVAKLDKLQEAVDRIAAKLDAD